MKFLKARSWILGIFMFLFGALKLINPFNGQFHTQLITSGIGDFAFPFGVGAEIITGLIILVTITYKGKMLPRRFFTSIIFGSGLVVVIMITAIYVHLQPNVPANVLPLGIKPPVIPLSVLILAATNVLLTIKLYKKNSNPIICHK